MEETHRKYHEASALFPLLEGEEFEQLKADIAANGLLEPIWLHPDGSILDGRNRHRACIETGTEPRFRTWSNSGLPMAFVISMNLHRRHLNETQRGVIANKVAKMPAHRPEISAQVCALTQPEAAKALGVSRRTVQSIAKIEKEAPDLMPAMESGELTAHRATRIIKERKREQTREQNRQLVKESIPLEKIAVSGQRFQTILLDPPWDWGDEGDRDQLGRARPTYGTMSLEEILALSVDRLAMENAHIYLCITNRSLPKGFALLENWGFRYITMLTWCKPHFGMGNYFRGSTEHILFGVKGSLPLLRKDVGTWFQADRPGVHSGKPKELYELVEQCSPGPWLEMFARKARPGWVAWGAEL